MPAQQRYAVVEAHELHRDLPSGVIAAATAESGMCDVTRDVHSGIADEVVPSVPQVRPWGRGRSAVMFAAWSCRSAAAGAFDG